MRAPKTTTLFWLAAVLFLLCAVSIPNYYPAPIPVLGPDGSPLLKPDGKPVVHRDMTAYYRYITPGLIFLASGVCLFFWWLIRVARQLYGRFFGERRTS